MRDAAGEPADRFHLLRLAQLLLAFVQRAVRLPVAQRVADGALQVRAHQMLLDVIGRAFAQRRFVERAAAVARHQDEGLVGAHFLRGPDQIDARTIREPLIDEVDVMLVSFDALQAGRRRRENHRRRLRWK